MSPISKRASSRRNSHRPSYFTITLHLQQLLSITRNCHFHYVISTTESKPLRGNSFSASHVSNRHTFIVPLPFIATAPTSVSVVPKGQCCTPPRQSTATADRCTLLGGDVVMMRDAVLMVSPNTSNVRPRVPRTAPKHDPACTPTRYSRPGSGGRVVAVVVVDVVAVGTGGVPFVEVLTVGLAAPTHELCGMNTCATMSVTASHMRCAASDTHGDVVPSTPHTSSIVVLVDLTLVTPWRRAMRSMSRSIGAMCSADDTSWLRLFGTSTGDVKLCTTSVSGAALLLVASTSSLLKSVGSAKDRNATEIIGYSHSNISSSSSSSSSASSS
eukprot:PhM_4_TR10444/c1_g2_i4/m.72486